MSLRLVISLLLLVGVARSAENLTAGKSSFPRRTSIYTLPVPSLYMQAQDSNNASAWYTIRWVVDTATWQAHGYANSVESIANCKVNPLVCSNTLGQNHAYLDLSVATGVGTIGAINLRDGALHTIYPWAVSKTLDDATNDVLMQFAPFRLKWDSTNSNYFPEIQSSGTGGKINYNKHLILINSSDPCSTGAVTTNPCGTAAAGGLVCTVAGTAIYDNAPPGYWIKQRGASDCTNVRVISVPVTEAITRTALNTAIGTAMTFAASNSLEAIVRGWLFPNIVLDGTATVYSDCETGGTQQCGGIDGYLAIYGITAGATPVGAACVGNSYFLGKWAQDNPWLNQVGNLTPFTSFAVRPSTGVVLGKCTGCTAGSNSGSGKVWAGDFATSKVVIDDAIAATGSNPVGVAQFSITSAGGGTSHGVPEISPASIGTSLNSKITLSLCGTYPTPLTSANATQCIQQNNIMYVNDAAQYTLPTLSFVQGAGIISASGSVNGAVTVATAQPQTPIIAAMSTTLGGLALAGAHPAVYGASSAIEPCSYVWGKQMQNHEAILQRIGLGDSYEVAVWGSAKELPNLNAYGDPMAQAYIPPFAQGGSNTGGIVVVNGAIIQ